MNLNLLMAILYVSLYLVPKSYDKLGNKKTNKKNLLRIFLPKFLNILFHQACKTVWYKQDLVLRISLKSIL